MDSVAKSVFKSNGSESFKGTIRKYFGSGTHNIVELCFLLIDVPRRRFDKICKDFQVNDEKLRRSYQKK